MRLADALVSIPRHPFEVMSISPFGLQPRRVCPPCGTRRFSGWAFETEKNEWDVVDVDHAL